MDGSFFFYQKKFLKAARAAHLPFAHEVAHRLKALYILWKSEGKEQKCRPLERKGKVYRRPGRPAKDPRIKKAERNLLSFKLMTAAYHRWYYNKTEERWAVYVALKAQFNAEKGDIK